MKKFFYIAVAAIAALSSCSSNEDILGKNGQKATDVTEFTATIEGDATRTSYNSSTKKAEWLTDDEINVNGCLYKAKTAGATTTFIGEGAGLDNPYRAYYPASIFNDDKLTLPAEYIYYDGKFNMPMYAVSETTNLQFKNLCGVLAITVQSSQISKIERIRVSSDKRINGHVTAITDDGVLFNPDYTNENYYVTLTFPEPKNLTSNETFYIPLPTISKATLAITVEDGEHVYSMTSNIGNVKVERNNMYPITFNAPLINGHQYVVLAGLKWATENVPNSDSSPAAGHDANYGAYFTQDGSKGFSAKKAAESWGSDDNGTWKLPTKAQWEKLINKCDWTWVTSHTVNGKSYPGGALVTGKEGTEAGNKIFLPADGMLGYDGFIGRGYDGFYWSSDEGTHLFFDHNNMIIKSSLLSGDGMSVRPVSE